MPTDDEREDIDDGSTGGAIKWSPDNAVKPPAAAGAPGAPVSWENLFGGAPGGPGTPQQGAAQSPPAPQPDQAFARGPGAQPAPRPQPDNNPFTTPDGAPGMKPGPQPGRQTGPQPGPQSGPQPGRQPGPQPGMQPGTMSGQFNAAGVQPGTMSGQFNAAGVQPGTMSGQFNAAGVQPGTMSGQFNAAGVQPGTMSGQFNAAGVQQQPPSQQLHPQQPMQPPPQPVRPPAQPGQQPPQQMQQPPRPAPGSNPNPGSVSASSASYPGVETVPGPASSGQTAPKVYFTADDIEEEISREQGLPKPRPGGGAPPAPSPAPAPQAPAHGAGGPGAPYNQASSYVPGTASGQAPAVPGPQAGQSPYGQGPGSAAGAARPPVAPAAPAAGEDGEDGPDLSSVPELETARIWEQRTCKEILHGIIKHKRSDYAVALFASTDGAVQGEMLVVKSVVIHGAKLVDPDVSGYEAMKRMLSIPHGTYTLLDVTNYVESAQNLEQGLNVRITPLANALPDLPDTVDEIMGASQISRIRSKGPADLEAEVVKIKPPKSNLSLRERLPSTKMIVLIIFTILTLIMMLVVLYTRR